MLGFTKFKINRLVNRRELYSNFSYNKWNQLDTGSKWKCLQQLENHFAAEQGRPAVKVLPISSKEVRGDYGGYDPDKNVIYINRDLVEYGTLVGPVDINHPTQLDANMQLFDTIAHEGYHAYQGYAIKHPGFHKDMKQVKEWAINDRNVKYFRRGDEYLVQPRERDAWKYGSEKTREAFDEIEKYYGTEPGRAMYEKSVEDNSYENALERLWNNNPDALNQMYKEMMDAYEERYWENNSTVNLDPITVDEYDAISREAVNRYYEHLKNDPSLSNEDVMRMTEEMSEKYLTAVEEYRNAQKQEDEGFQEKSGDKESTEKRYKKEEIEKENPEHKRDVENQRKEEVEEENKSEKKDKLENREDEKDYEEEGAENKDKTETLSEDELEEERWNESESEDEAELLSDKAEAGEEQNAEDKAVTETESELQDNAADLSSEESSGETEDNSETEDNVEDLSSEESSEETEDESEEEDKAEDLSSEKSSGGIEDNSEEEDKAEDLSGEESSGKIEDESEEEDEAKDLSSEENSGETEDNSEEEDKAEDLSSGEDDSTSYESGGNEEDENYSY